MTDIFITYDKAMELAQSTGLVAELKERELPHDVVMDGFMPALKITFEDEQELTYIKLKYGL